MKRKYTYHLLRPGEEEDVYNLVLRVFHRFVAPTYTEDGIGTFLNMMSPDSLKEKSPNRFTIVAEHNDQIVGIVAMINVSHIALLFVDFDFHGN
jgi:predicted N-acetyltransferase YhbS